MTAQPSCQSRSRSESNAVVCFTVARPARGMGLLETMISLSIVAMLLLACASAFTASASAINNNDAFFRCTQAGRVTLGQILAEIRNCDSLDMSQAKTIKIIRAAPSAQNGAVQRYAAQPNEVSRAFVYDPAQKRVTLQITYTSSVSPVYELTTNVSSCAFGPVDLGTDYRGLSIPIHVPISITISSGGNTVALTGSAMPRRAMTY